MRRGPHLRSSEAVRGSEFGAWQFEASSGTYCVDAGREYDACGRVECLEEVGELLSHPWGTSAAFVKAIAEEHGLSTVDSPGHMLNERCPLIGVDEVGDRYFDQLGDGDLFGSLVE